MISPRGGRLVVALAVCASALVGLAPPAAAKTSSLESKIAGAQKAANAAAAKLHKASTELEQAQADIAKLRSQSAAIAGKITSLQAHLKGYAIREFQNGTHSTSHTLFDDPSVLARSRFFARRVTLGSVDELEKYKMLRDDEAQNQTALSARLKQRLRAVNSIKAQQAAITSQLAALGKAMKAQKNGSRLLATGVWVCPVQGPHAFTNDWGQPRSGGRTHKGTDLLSPYGTPVVASVAGTVIDHDRGLGGKSYFLHGVDGHTYYGAHLSRFGATGRVSQGQIVGYVGTSGNAKGGPAHLHFEIHPGNGAPVNPYGTLRVYC